MSRFSPDTWLDAMQLPFAMIQFKGNVYVEPIAPDLRPAAFIGLVIFASLVAFRRKRAGNFQAVESVTAFNHRAAWALVTSTMLALVAWIFSSGNGRYGLLAITLSPLAALAALLIATQSNRIRAWILCTLIFVQATFLLTADPNDTWSRLTLHKWNEEYADKLPATVVAPWRNIASKKAPLVVTTRVLTGMTGVYQVFGPEAIYVGLAYLDAFAVDSPERKRALEITQSAEVIYLSRAIGATSESNETEKKIPSPVKRGEKKRLLRFGLAIEDGAECSLLPSRMGVQLQICPLVKVVPDLTDQLSDFPQPQLQILNALAEKCPSVFGEARMPMLDDLGGVVTATHDGKYYIEVAQDMSVYIRHLGEIEHRLLISGSQVGSLSNYSCESIMKAGLQYWR